MHDFVIPTHAIRLLISIHFHSSFRINLKVYIRRSHIWTKLRDRIVLHLFFNKFIISNQNQLIRVLLHAFKKKRKKKKSPSPIHFLIKFGISNNKLIRFPILFFNLICYFKWKQVDKILFILYFNGFITSISNTTLNLW